MADNANIYPFILYGGSGTRLWPVSRRSYRKQFSPLFTGDTLFQRTCARIAGQGYVPPLLLTASDFRFIVAEQMSDVGVDATRIVIEPEMRNTGPAVCLAALTLAWVDTEALMLVPPSDHMIRDPEPFHQTVRAGAEAARAGRLVTFGIHQSRPETGHGYLDLPGPSGEGP